MSGTLVTLLSIEDVARYLGVAPRTIWEWKSTGYGPKRIRVGRRTWFLETDVHDWLESLELEDRVAKSAERD
jgi:excisionase family DNA binding protein